MTNVTRVEIHKAEDKGELDPGEQWYYNGVAANGEVVVTSEMFPTRWNAERAALATFPEAEAGIVRDSEVTDRPLPDE